MEFCTKCGFRIHGAAVCPQCGHASGTQDRPVSALANGEQQTSLDNHAPEVPPAPVPSAPASAWPAPPAPDAAAFPPPAPPQGAPMPPMQPGLPPQNVEFASAAPSAFVAAAQQLPAQVWGKAALYGVLGYAGTFAATVVVCVIMLAGGGATSIGTGSAFGLFIQMTNLAFFGAIGYGGASMVFVPLIPLGAGVALTFIAARTFLRIPELEAIGLRVLLSTVSGAVAALVTTLLAALIPYSFYGVEARSVTLWSFLFAFIVIGGTSFVALGKPGALRRIGAARGKPAVGEQLVVAISAQLGYLTILGLVSVVAVIVMCFQGLGYMSVGQSLAALPLVLPTVMIWTIDAMSLGAVTLGSSGYALNIGLFSDVVPVWASILGILFFVCAIGAAALVLYTARRGTVPHGVSWALTPGVFAVSALLMQLFGRIYLAGGSGLLGISGSLAPAGWSFLLFAVWGLVAELVSRYLLPILFRNPAVGITGWLAGYLPAATAQSTLPSVRVPSPGHPMTPPAPGQQPYSVQTPPYGPPQAQAQAQAPVPPQATPFAQNVPPQPPMPSSAPTGFSAPQPPTPPQPPTAP